MEAKLQKKLKRGNYIVQTSDRSYKDKTFLFTKQQPMCHACQKHILIESTDLAHLRKTYRVNNMKELFQKTEM